MAVFTKYRSLYSAIREGDMLGVMLHMHEGVSPDTVIDERNRTVLMYAVLEDKRDIVEILLDRGADVHMKDVYGYHALDFAAQNDNVEIAKLLCEHAEPEVEFFTSVLSQFVVNENLEMVEFMLQMGADVTRHVNGYKSALAEAINNFDPSRSEILQALIKHGNIDINAYIEHPTTLPGVSYTKLLEVRDVLRPQRNAHRHAFEHDIDGPTMDR